MLKKLLTIILFFSTIDSYSQSKQIVGSWLFRDSANAISFFIKENGTIEKRAGLAGEYIWDKAPQIGTYTFNKQATLVITWADKSIENGKVKFVDNFTAEIQFTSPKNKVKKIYTFKKIVDEEVVPDK
ncbi:hypothetical protein LK994_13785 [Ferruginibacter lapsinanis]|uniref:hypothetical protein n=1 Tax=Ferruginibacter lapsinanis TaxID=563172 RepID=UPI001E38688A|nr:hypothetical protein [Ferruginibacter lapsinanis]UEG49708.1 hypothetical protein LK994_13785 [Ferruginibacter lapsinanis]